MGLITEHDGAATAFESVVLPPDPPAATQPVPAMLRRRSPRPSRRAVLYLQCLNDSFVPEDLAAWYTERGFHFYVADLRPQLMPGQPAHSRTRRMRLSDCFAELDAACEYMRAADGIDSVIVSAHGSGALAAALWCDARRDQAPADALVLASPRFGRRLRHGLDITCPVLVLTGPADAAAPVALPGIVQRGITGARRQLGLRPSGHGRHSGRYLRLTGSASGSVQLGPHVTWLSLEDETGSRAAAEESRRRFFDEMGRWLGAYMYGRMRDQLL
jgi:hypothetical protein